MDIFLDVFCLCYLFKQLVSKVSVPCGIHCVISDEVHYFLVLVSDPKNLTQIHDCCYDLRQNLIKYGVGGSPCRMTAAISGQLKPLNVRCHRSVCGVRGVPPAFFVWWDCTDVSK